jgi:UDP-glucose 4-epimerase
VRDWIYAPDVGEAVACVLEAEALRYPLYHVGPGRAHSVLDWGVALAGRRPGWTCRLADAGEVPNVDPQGERDRAPLAVGRLAEDAGFRARYDPAGSVEHLDAWSRAHAGWFTGSDERVGGR